MSTSGITDAAIYLGTHAQQTDQTPAQMAEYLGSHPGTVGWIAMLRPHHREVTEIAHHFDLPDLAVEDTIIAHQRPKLERYGDCLFLVLRAATLQQHALRFGELHVFATERFVIAVRHASWPDLAQVQTQTEADPAMLEHGAGGIVLKLLDAVIDGYAPVLDDLDARVQDLESDVYRGTDTVSKNIYQLSRSLLDLQLAVRPLGTIIQNFSADPLSPPGVDHELRDIEDHAIVLNERVERLRASVKGSLDLNISLATLRQNEKMEALTESTLKQAEDSRRIAAWAGVLFVPSLITGIYGMNFDRMPELHWAWGYPVALILMVVTGVGMFAAFRSNRWL